MEKFYFTPIANIETQTFDNSLEHFHEAGISGTIRENIQNSLDAKLSKSDDPVKVYIKLDSIHKDNIPGINEIEKHIMALKPGNKYTRDTVEDMQTKIKTTIVPVMTFEDSNTKGLSGAESLDEETTYSVFAYKKGVHYEEKNEEVEVIRGGSHGVGKIANNAASDIHLMYFANCDDAGNQHIGGTIQLIEHEMGERCYRSTGYFSGFNTDKNYVPYKNKGNHSVFNKETRGLKIIIPFLREDYNNIKDIVTAVCDNFFLALLKNELEVSINVEGEKILINGGTIEEISRNTEYYPDNLSDKGNIKKVFTPLYVDTYLRQVPRKIEVESNSEAFCFDLYFSYDEEIKAGRVGIVRSMGMKIVDHKVKGYVRRPFNAVLIGGPKEDEYLKTLENESHTDLSTGAIRDKKYKRDANAFLRDLNLQISKIVDEEYEHLNPSDGKIDTSDLLYEREITFKSKMETLSEKIELKKGNTIRKKKTKERRGKGDNNVPSPGSPAEPRERKPRKLKSSSEEEATTETILAPNETVSRIVMRDVEILQFNLQGIKEVMPNGVINVGIRVVDGEGKEYDDEFDMQKSYSQVSDEYGGIDYRFDSFSIYDVRVVNGLIKLKINKKNNSTDTLKFIYKLEVLQ